MSPFLPLFVVTNVRRTIGRNLYNGGSGALAVIHFGHNHVSGISSLNTPSPVDTSELVV
jgi:hypothetical protein